MQQFLVWGICPYILYPNGNVECICEDVGFPNLDDVAGNVQCTDESVDRKSLKVRLNT